MLSSQADPPNHKNIDFAQGIRKVLKIVIFDIKMLLKVFGGYIGLICAAHGGHLGYLLAFLWRLECSPNS